MIKVGSVCVCQHGKLGVVTKELTRHETTWHGVSFDGGKWQSTKPTLIADTIGEYINDIIDEYEDELDEACPSNPRK